MPLTVLDTTTTVKGTAILWQTGRQAEHTQAGRLCVEKGDTNSTHLGANDVEQRTISMNTRRVSVSRRYWRCSKPPLRISASRMANNEYCHPAVSVLTCSAGKTAPAGGRLQSKQNGSKHINTAPAISRK
jgi:hypothetical protein